MISYDSNDWNAALQPRLVCIHLSFQARHHQGAYTDQVPSLHRRGFERFLRKLAKLPQWPALLYLHVWQPAYMGPAFWTGGEMQIETILQYYGVPSVSARSALFHLAARNEPGFSENDTNCGVHPNPLGHRCAPTAVLSGCLSSATSATWPGARMYTT